ncbi:FRIGIDA-like protein 3 [Andrographis paniculata]|uniref:FRIGIDA-like protein 3 n=1 Tax=Andrographis paniculata TaxID=175694 RepID=UPI0021E8FF34|nr:FRIGIDA-like protein 3 [Andrographis paniculata]XP_051143788.1 FRIGIDA-like protein 3 [Andrographis paniculata]
MEENLSAATLMDSTASKIQQLQKAFAELESHRAVTLNMKWKQLEEHFNGLQKSLKRRFTELEEQEKEFESKIVESREMLEKRKAAVFAKEQTSLEKLQEKRDAAVSAILTAMNKPISSSLGVSGFENKCEALVLEEKTPAALVTASNTDGAKMIVENTSVQVKAYPELVKLCQEMNSDGLHKFISDNRKDLVTLREEIPIALKAASDPASLVLDSLKGFYGTDVPNSDAKKDSNLLGIRRTCIMLMECLSCLFQNLDSGSPSVFVSENSKDRAKVIAEEWKPKLDYLDIDASNGNSLEAHAFLQLLASFGINSDFDQEFLSKLIPMVSRRRQTAELCRFLGLSDKMPGVIDVLVKNGRQIDAVNLAFAFELTNQFSPVSLLTSYLSEAKKVTSPAKPGNASPSGLTQSDVNEKELAALKAVIKCVEDHKLEAQFPVDPLQKQVVEIEKAKADKKRATDVGKPQSKRPRGANGVAAAHAPRAAPNIIANDKNFYARIPERYPQYVYDRPPYAYPAPPPPPQHHHIPPPPYVPAAAAYSFTPGNFYQYQTAAAYLH